MVQGYYTLEESANLLGMSPDDLKQLARKREIRSFQDGGTWRFRIQDIQEMVRRRADSSDLELAAAQPPNNPTDSPAPRGPKAPGKEPEVFSLAQEDEHGVNLGADIHLDKGPHSSGGKKPGSSKKLPPPGSDSDVRLVADGSDVTFHVPADSDVKVKSSDAPKSGPKSSDVGVGHKTPKPAKNPAADPAAKGLDSGVRLVPLDSDSDVRIVGSESDDADVPVGDKPPKAATDSDIRLEGHVPASRGTGLEGQMTEEINLDEELKKDDARRQEQSPPAKAKPKQPEFPKKSPFELSTSDLNLAPLEDQLKAKDSSSDFDLTPAGESSSPLELSSSDDFKLDVPDDDEVSLMDDRPSSLKEKASGINLGKPADSGISLEQHGSSGQESEFELTLDPEAATKPMTPKPAASKLVEPEDSDSSEFELKLDVDGGSSSDSDSEFELTLDDTGGLSPLESDAGEEGEEKDIFETDFEVPALGEESGSQAVAVDDSDTALESSDFELAIGEEDAVAEDDSASEVVALDEDEMLDEEPAPRRGKKKGKKKPAEDEDLDDVAIEDEEDIVIEEEEPIAAAAVPQAPWGIFPVAVLFPCVIVMVLLGMLGIELVQTQQGYKPGLLTRAIGGLIDGKK